MAQVNDPKSPRRGLDDLGDTREVERVSRGGWRWWWVWAVVVALVIWWAGFGWGGSGGFWRGALHSATKDSPQNGAIENRALRGTPPTANATTGNGNGAANSPSAIDKPQAQTNGPGLAVLEAPNKQSYVGKNFQANDVPVQKKVTDRVIWVGTGDTNPMLAVIQGNANNPDFANIQQGELVNATGTVQKAPSASQAEHQWNLSGDDAKRLEQEGAYIQISQLQTPQPQ